MLSEPTSCVVDGLVIKRKIKADESPTWNLKLQCPMTYPLAVSMFPPMVGTLYHEVGGEWVPWEHMKSEGIEMPFGGLDFVMREHPELKVMGSIAEAQVSDCKATKNDAGSFDFSFTVSFPEPTDPIMLFLVKRVKQGLYVTLRKNDLLEDAEPDAPAGPTAVATSEATG